MTDLLNIEQERRVRRSVLERTLAALEAAADDAMSYGPSEADADYLAAIAEAKAELETHNRKTK